MRAASIFLIVVSLIAAYLAYGQYSERETIVAEATALTLTVQALQGKLSKLESLKPKRLDPPDAALENLLGRLIDDTELLGSSVRLELAQQGMAWAAVEHGVKKVTLGFSTQAEKEAGLAYFSMVWQILSEQPVRVVDAEIRVTDDIAKFRVGVELFALEGDGT